jgi:hypothetical protein
MKIVKSILISISAVFLLLSTVGFSINKHYCGVEYQSGILSQPDMECQHAESTNTCVGNEDMQQECSMHMQAKDDCCDIVNIFIKGFNFDYPAMEQMQIQPNFNLISIAVFEIGFNVDEVSTTHSSTYYVPPPLKRDIPVLIQSFLI